MRSCCVSLRIRSLAEVGAMLGASEDAAKMRVNRALEKLRKFFLQRGVDSTTAAIMETISANSLVVAPAALAKTATAAALSKGATASASTLTLIKGALKIMAWTKAKNGNCRGFGTALGDRNFCRCRQAGEPHSRENGK